MVLTGRCERTAQVDGRHHPKLRRCRRILFRSFSHRDDHLGFLLEVLGRQPLQTPTRLPKQRLPPSLLERRPAVPAAPQTRPPGDKLRTAGPVDERLDPQTATVNPAASSSLFTFWGVFTSSCQESFSATSAAPAASSSSTHWLRARLSRSVPGEQADRPPGPQTRQASANPAVGRGRWNNMKAITTASKDPSGNGSSAASPTSSGKSRGPQGHHRLGSIQANDQCPRRRLVKVREQRSHPQPRSRTRRASASGSSSSSHRARPTRTGAHRSR